MEANAVRDLATIERLREQIRKLQAAPRTYLSGLRTGIAPFDGLFPGGGLPLGQAIELWGEAASGRTSLALRAVAAAHREARLAAFLDGPRELYPPAAAALGVQLERLLIVRPKAPGQLIWSAVQLLRSGAFACVVLDLTHTGVRPSLAEGRKLCDAALKSGSLLLTLTPPESPAEGMTRVRTEPVGKEGLSVEVVHSRLGGMGRRAQVPWEAIYPGLASARPKLEVAPVPAIRVRPLGFVPSGGRDGPLGICGQRPGRDMQLAPLGQSFGAGGAR